MFDTDLFLSLPIDIRHHVYFFLGEEIQTVKPPLKQDIFTRAPTEYVKVEQYDKTIAERYASFISVYEYIPNFVSNWCYTFELMRYDAIFRDRLIVDREYENEWFLAEWIMVGDEPQIGIFTLDEQFLQIGFTVDEYCDVLDIRKQDLRLGINASDVSDSAILCKQLQHQWLLDTVLFVSFVNCWDMEEPNVAVLISYMEYFSNLKSLKIESQRMFNNLINTKGVRENPGKTVVYNVRRNISVIELFSVRDLGYKDSINLERWESLQRLCITGSELIDFNLIVFPSQCKSLVIEDCKYIIWWNTSEFQKQIKETWIEDNRIIKPSTNLEEEELWYSLYFNIIEMYRPITEIRLKNVRRIKGNIIIPRYFSEESRIHVPGTTKAQPMLLI